MSSDSGFGPELAIDGNTNGDFHGGMTCFILLYTDVNNWWQVRLAEVSLISEVKIYNRVGDYRGNRL